MAVPTRFIKAKVDKYIQLYSKYGKNEGTTYDRVQQVLIVVPGTGFTSAPTLTFTPHAPGSSNVQATEVCLLALGLENHHYWNFDSSFYLTEGPEPVAGLVLFNPRGDSPAGLFQVFGPFQML